MAKKITTKCDLCQKAKKIVSFDRYSAPVSNLMLCKKCTKEQDDRIQGWHKAEAYGENL